MKTEMQKRDDHQGHILSRRDEPVNPFLLIDRFIDNSLWDSFGMLAPNLLRSRGLGNVSTIFPRVDVEEMDNEIRVTANIPGIDPNNVHVEVGDDYLSLSGKIEKENRNEDKKGKVYRYEREYGEFRREFALPARVNKDGIIAKSKNGVLTITLPKSEEEIKKRIQIDIE